MASVWIADLSTSVLLLYTSDLNAGLEMNTSHSMRVSVGARGPGLSSNGSLAGLLLHSARRCVSRFLELVWYRGSGGRTWELRQPAASISSVAEPS